ncbi:hypothetical protein ACH5RR_005660 [Cinchona calisaya]|uniref:Serine/arginine-rich splicing factor 4 n=1 Tax=Cinchona calisaya TaxID=153742 RepID=A0ABD3ALU5_9GENT
MSLHLGNLSSRIHRNELERVFRRFGLCNVQVKGKFGFVIYKYPANAEQALKMLRGKKICGEKITLSWSNRQQRLLQRSDRSDRSYEPPRGRRFAREGYANRKWDSDVREGNRRSSRQGVGGGRRLGYPDLIDEAKNYLKDVKDYEGEKCHEFVQDLTDEGGAVGTDLLENDRWGNQVVENELENGMDFDRYEPYQDDYKKEEDIHNSPHLVSSPPVRRSLEKPEIEQVDQLVLEHPNDAKLQKSCYVCGEAGHRMQKCPRQLKRLETRSRGRLRLDRDDASTGWRKNDREASTSRNSQGLGYGDSSEVRSTHRGTEKDYHQKKRNSKEYGSPERHQLKKARVPVSSSIHSDYTASGSRSQSRSRTSLSGSHYRSKSLPSRKNSGSSRSLSGSTSSHTRNQKIQSQSISRSTSPTSLSLTVSLGRPLPSSPNKVQISQKDYFVNSSGLEVKESSFGVENRSSGAPIKPEDDGNNSDSQRMDGAYKHSIIRDLCEIKESCLPQSENTDQNARNVAPKILTETRDLKSYDFATEDMLIPTKNSELQASGKLNAASLTSISSKDISMVHKNYGLEHPDEIEYNLPSEIYFGSARLWPWEIIYYRRLRKGPISKDNYARRLSQNEEFGIVDKYIRSSSGWGELTDENPGPVS